MAGTDTDTDSTTIEVEPEQQETQAAVEGEHEGQQTEQQVEGEQADGAEGGDEEEVVISIGDEPVDDGDIDADPDGKAAKPWVKELRLRNRELVRTLRERDEEVKRLKTSSAPKVEPLGEEPTLESCGYDADVFKTELKAYFKRKEEAAAEDRRKEEADKNARAAWQKKIDSYTKAKASLKVRDFADAEGIAQDALSVTQQGVILNGADRPELLIYALGKNTKKLKELASIEDPVKFAFAVAKLETQLKVAPRKSAPAPEQAVRSSAPVTGAVDSHLARLRSEAEKTGDYSKVTAYKNQQRQKQRA